jgi:hypothetical protein
MLTHARTFPYVKYVCARTYPAAISIMWPRVALRVWVAQALLITSIIMGSDNYANAVTDGKNSNKSQFTNINVILPYTQGNAAAIDGSAVLHSAVISRIRDLQTLVALAKHGHKGEPLPEVWEQLVKAGFGPHKLFVEEVLLSIPLYIFDGRKLPTKIEDAKRAEARTKAYDEAFTRLARGETTGEVIELLRKSLIRTPEMTRVAIEYCQMIQVCACAHFFSPVYATASARVYAVSLFFQPLFLYPLLICSNYFLVQAGGYLAPYEADSLGAHINRIGQAAYVIADDSDWIVHGALFQLFGAISVPKPTASGAHTYRMHLFSRADHMFTAHKKVDMTDWNENDALLLAALANSDFLNIPGIGFGKAKDFVNLVRKECEGVTGGTENTEAWALAIRTCIPKNSAMVRHGTIDGVFNADGVFTDIWKALLSFRTQPVFALDLPAAGHAPPEPFWWVRIDWEPKEGEAAYAAPMLDELQAEVCACVHGCCLSVCQYTLCY